MFKARREYKESPELLVHKGRLAHRVFKVSRALQVLPVFEELPVHKA